MKLIKLARDVRSDELTQDENDKLRRLWADEHYRLPLEDGLALRDRTLSRKPLNLPPHLEHLENWLRGSWNRWADSGLPVLLFPTTLVQL